MSVLCILRPGLEFLPGRVYKMPAHASTSNFFSTHPDRHTLSIQPSPSPTSVLSRFSVWCPLQKAVKCCATLEGEGTILKCFSCPAATSRPQKDTETSDEAKLSKIQCIIRTKSMKAGINGKYLEFAKTTGLSSLFYELVQQMGRVDRNVTAVRSAKTYI